MESTFPGVLVEQNGFRNLLVSFGGIRAGMGMPIFEFYNSFDSFQCDKIFIKDEKQCWYQKGINDSIPTIGAVEQYLREIIAGYDKVCFTGNSMGGYAALYFGKILNVHKVIAFSPQSFIERKKRWIYRDRRWALEIENCYQSPNLCRTSLDLKVFFKRNKCDFPGHMEIYYSNNDRLDERMARFKYIKLISFDYGDHGLVRNLKENGDLVEILENAFA